MSAEEIADVVLQFNNKRKTSKGKWLFFDCATTIGVLQIKSWETWIQVASLNGHRDAGPMDCSVAKCSDWLTAFLVGVVEWGKIHRGKQT